ncbi:MAG: phosphatidylserine decarboxylase [Endomicrobiaceae bacterium]|nr:phosphatidylserine decarboxylase [Endomicrobiaceae bacterium]
MSIVKEGYPFIVIALVIGILLMLFGFAKIGFIAIVVAVFFTYFFRDPNITITQVEGLILSPCNGTVLEIKENDNGQSVIRVFLSVFDVHLQRTPVAGTVKSVEYKPGKFLKAHDPQAHIVNEKNIITIENENGKYIVEQIAGILARRCVSWVKPGDILKVGDKIGVIKFGSQVDLYMPTGYKINIKQGDKVISGVTVFASIK